jgi:predicted ATPase
MNYRESNKDKALRQWFNNDTSKALLREIRLKKGQLRGLNALDLRLEFPITAIAGRNGAGKSTVLALACCAFHNSKDGFRLPKRTLPYYTFRDFFIQHADEVPLDGVEIIYVIAHDKWKKTEQLPSGVGLGYQKRSKRKGGKWTDYDKRVRRNVVFLGIERIVPHSERSQSRSYSRVFKDAKAKGWEDKVKNAVGHVLQKSYDKFRYLEYSKYSLPIVQQGSVIYSGFNMGAGENALFEIFSTLYSCGHGALLVMDEVELGLHAEAQRRFIDRLKDVCLELRTQVICTTHSREIFEALPPDARYYIESINKKTKLTNAISADFAFAKMGAVIPREMDLFVEDSVARSLLIAAFPVSIRNRVNVRTIGSASAISRQLAALYVRKEDKPTLAVFDGDQRGNASELLKHAKAMAETNSTEFQDWFNSRIAFLPGKTWPEAWIVQGAKQCIKELAAALLADVDSLSDILEYGLQAGKHNEFYEMAKHLGLNREQCLQVFAGVVCEACADELKELVTKVKTHLGS